MTEASNDRVDSDAKIEAQTMIDHMCDVLAAKVEGETDDFAWRVRVTCYPERYVSTTEGGKERSQPTKQGPEAIELNGTKFEGTRLPDWATAVTLVLLSSEPGNDTVLDETIVPGFYDKEGKEIGVPKFFSRVSLLVRSEMGQALLGQGARENNPYWKEPDGIAPQEKKEKEKKGRLA